MSMYVKIINHKPVIEDMFYARHFHKLKRSVSNK